MTMTANQPGTIQFVNDDDGYNSWLQENPSGFVVNSERSPKSSYLILHKAACRHINSSARSNWTTTDYIKTCSNDVSKLEAWALQRTGGSLQCCGACKPESESGVSVSIPPVIPPSPQSVKRDRTAGISIPSPQHSVTGNRQIPDEISTGCPELDLVWRTYAADILGRPHVLIPDTEYDLNWHAFLGHSIDMQGFRAAEFAGVDPLSKHAPDFVPLRQRGIGICELAELWNIPEIQQHILNKSSGTPLHTTLDVLKTYGKEIGRSLAEAFDTFPYRKGHWTVRALLQNSDHLGKYGFSFRQWLQDHCRELQVEEFPPGNFRQPVGSVGRQTLEKMLRLHLDKAFFQVGPALAAYMLCDWQLWLWNERKTEVFANFKLDSFHEKFVDKYGRGVIPPDEDGFVEWWFSHQPDLPPRLANECIWLGIENGVV